MRKRLLSISVAVLMTATAVQAAWAPAGDDIKTRWATEVNPQHPLPEYPRPQMVRQNWLNLNGLWNYAVRPLDETPEAKGKFTPDGEILVPFCIESALSGVGRMVGRDNNLWYERTFTLPKGWNGKQILLHFGAVDWQAEVWVNGQRIGAHTGGYTPFCFDITSALKKSGTQTLRVKVFDATDQTWQPRGKQVSTPKGIWYTPVTGIWQTVWLEAVAFSHIDSYYTESDPDTGDIYVSVEASGLLPGDKVLIALAEGGQGYSAEQPSSRVLAEAEGTEVIFTLPQFKTWSPDDPYLYGLSIRILRNGRQIDRVEGYTAIREVSRIRTSDGYNRIALNGKALFQFGPLDQGWWPDGLYTAPTDEALRFDIEKTKELGFNMIRKHIKVEPARWYWWCDALGILVWQDMPCIADHSRDVNQARDEEVARAQMNQWPNDSFLGGTDCRVPERWKDNYYKEWGEIIDCLKGFPCIVVWIPFNEAWGQFDTPDVVAFTRELDPTRLVNEASGGNYHLSGDIQDIHHYPEPKMNAFEGKLINVLGEYGGIGYPVPGHLWRSAEKTWGYGGNKTSIDEMMDQYEAFAQRLGVFVTTGCAAAVYTQTTDVEVEVNGLMTYDRIVKVDVDRIRAINEKVIATPLFDAKKFIKR